MLLLSDCHAIVKRLVRHWTRSCLGLTFIPHFEALFLKFYQLHGIPWLSI